MSIDWSAFGEVFVVSFGTAVGVMILFAIGVSLLAGRPSESGTGEGGDMTGLVQAAPTVGARALAGLCFLACALTVAYGLYIIISK